MPRVRVRFLGPSADIAGAQDCALDVADGATVGALAGKIAEQHPSLGRAPGVRLALNRRFVALDTVVRDGDEVAVIPPVSGG
ncbi:MAG: MoaD/ThiS family protein [Phycisphaerae bacterium]|nr:MoaD/ThiS family protein [Phycisphaerae bacterium]